VLATAEKQKRQTDKGRLVLVVAIVCIRCLAPLHAMPLPDPLEVLNSAIKWIGGIQQDSAQFIISPLQKQQANDHLDKMLNRLRKLELSKRDLLTLTGNPQIAEGDIARAVQTIDGELQDVRQSTDEFIRFLPDKYRTDGHTISNGLVDGLSEKRQIYDNGLNRLRAGDYSKQQFAIEEQQAICLVGRLEDSVVRLQASINGSQLPSLRDCPSPPLSPKKVGPTQK
jgi:hypothetical protein